MTEIHLVVIKQRNAWYGNYEVQLFFDVASLQSALQAFKRQGLQTSTIYLGFSPEGQRLFQALEEAYRHDPGARSDLERIFKTVRQDGCVERNREHEQLVRRLLWPLQQILNLLYLLFFPVWQLGLWLKRRKLR